MQYVGKWISFEHVKVDGVHLDGKASLSNENTSAAGIMVRQTWQFYWSLSSSWEFALVFGFLTRSHCVVAPHFGGRPLLETTFHLLKERIQGRWAILQIEQDKGTNRGTREVPYAYHEEGMNASKTSNQEATCFANWFTTLSADLGL